MILDIYLRIGFVEEVTNNSNGYVEKRRLLELNIQVWDKKNMSTPFDIKSLHHLLDLIFYMAIVHLPCKKKYWKDDDIWTYNIIMHEVWMSRDLFVFMWRHFILQVYTYQMQRTKRMIVMLEKMNIWNRMR